VLSLLLIHISQQYTLATITIWLCTQGKALYSHDTSLIMPCDNRGAYIFQYSTLLWYTIKFIPHCVKNEVVTMANVTSVTTKHIFPLWWCAAKPQVRCSGWYVRNQMTAVGWSIKLGAGATSGIPSFWVKRHTPPPGFTSFFPSNPCPGKYDNWTISRYALFTHNFIVHWLSSYGPTMLTG
jgi:hypothetical protein